MAKARTTALNCTTPAAWSHGPNGREAPRQATTNATSACVGSQMIVVTPDGNELDVDHEGDTIHAVDTHRDGSRPS